MAQQFECATMLFSDEWIDIFDLVFNSRLSHCSSSCVTRFRVQVLQKGLSRKLAVVLQRFSCKWLSSRCDMPCCHSYTKRELGDWFATAPMELEQLRRWKQGDLNIEMLDVLNVPLPSL